MPTHDQSRTTAACRRGARRLGHGHRPWSILFALLLLAWGVIPSLAVADLRAGEWPQFQGGPGHAAAATAGAIDPPLARAWTFREPGGDRGVSGAVVVGGTAITVGRSGVYGIDVDTGRQRWRLFRERGPLATPAVATVDGRQLLLFTQGERAARARLVAVDLERRREVWRIPLAGPSRSGVTVSGGRAFVGDRSGRLYAVDASSGKLLWTFRGQGSIDGAPAVSAETVYFATRGGGEIHVEAVNESTGRTVWDFAPNIGPGLVSGVSAADGMVFVGTGDRVVRALDAESGDERWGSRLGSSFSPLSAPAVSGGDLFVADLEAGLYRLDGGSGSRVWYHPFDTFVLTGSPVVAGEEAFLGLDDGRLVAVDLRSGDLLWEGSTGPGALGPIALGAGRLIVSKGGKTGGLIAFRHDPGGRLLHLPSPARLDLGRTLLAFALAFAAVFGFVLGAALALRRFWPVEGLRQEAEAEGTDRL